MSLNDYSKMLGLSRNYLSMFRFNRKLPLGMEASKVYEIYNKEAKHQESVICSMQDLYYDLKDTISITLFSEYVYKKGIYGHNNSFCVRINSYFSNVKSLRSREFIAKCERILEAYEYFKKEKR